MAPVTEGGEHYLGSASDDGLVKVRPIVTINAPHRTASHSNSASVLVQVWKMSTLTEQHVCEGHLDDVLSLSMDFYTPQKVSQPPPDPDHRRLLCR